MLDTEDRTPANQSMPKRTGRRAELSIAITQQKGEPEDITNVTSPCPAAGSTQARIRH